MKSWTDKMLTGILLGLVTPAISFQLYMLLFRSGENTIDALNRYKFLNVLTHVISLSAIPNLLVFFLFLWAGKERSAFGVIGATIIYALFVAVLIFI